jgi:hypothetical protein
MRTITKTLYEFDELSEEAKDKARSDKEEEMRENEQHDAFQWAIDDCSLFEPPHTEMAALLGEDYYDRNKHGEYGQFVFKNTRKGISYSAGNDMVAIADALEITNDQMFKTWLGVPEIFHSHVTYNIENFGRNQSKQTTIEFEHDYMGDDPRASLLAEILDKAQDKFNNHLWSIGDRISNGIECYFESDNVESRLEDCEFDEEGNIQ